jgi:hypothetical protein
MLHGTGIEIAVSLMIPLGNQATPHCMQAFHLRGAPWTVTLCFSPFAGGLLFGDSGRHTWMNDWMNKYTSGSGERVSLSMGTLLGNMERAPYCGLWGKDKKRYIKRDIKMPCKRVSLSIGTPLGNLEEIRSPGLFEWTGQYIWVPFLYPEDIKILNPEAIWNFGKGTGLSWADIRLWGTKGNKAQVHRDHKSLYPKQIYLSIYDLYCSVL